VWDNEREIPEVIYGQAAGFAGKVFRGGVPDSAGFERFFCLEADEVRVPCGGGGYGREGGESRKSLRQKEFVPIRRTEWAR
jgi:hypothetical protein